MQAAAAEGSSTAGALRALGRQSGQAHEEQQLVKPRAGAREAAPGDQEEGASRKAVKEPEQAEQAEPHVGTRQAS